MEGNMKRVKAILIVLMIFIMAITFVACGATGNNPSTDDNGDISIGGGDDTTQTPDKPTEDDDTQIGGENNDKVEKILVVYFSCTNNTKGRAEALQSKLNANIYRIVPAVPYTNDDLNYNNSSSRANREQNDPTSRPEISGTVEDMAQYDVIYIGYPIWWGQAPKIIYTFLESYNFAGKTLIPFCTSGSSPMGSSGTHLHSSAQGAIWKSGCRVGSSNDIDVLAEMK